MFVVVEFKDIQYFLLNPDCQVITIVSYIRKKLLNHVSPLDPKTEVLDLVDGNGNLIGLPKCTDIQNVSNKFVHRGIYYPVALNVYGEGFDSFKLLLADLEDDGKRANTIKSITEKLSKKVTRRQRTNNSPSPKTPPGLRPANKPAKRPSVHTLKGKVTESPSRNLKSPAVPDKKPVKSPKKK